MTVQKDPKGCGFLAATRVTRLKYYFTVSSWVSSKRKEIATNFDKVKVKDNIAELFGDMPQFHLIVPASELKY